MDFTIKIFKYVPDLQRRNQVPAKTMGHNFAPDFLEDRRQLFAQLLLDVGHQARTIFASPKAQYYFGKLLAPTQMGDDKPAHWTAPFPLEKPSK